jgi:hypothetical protein
MLAGGALVLVGTGLILARAQNSRSGTVPRLDGAMRED